MEHAFCSEDRAAKTSVMDKHKKNTNIKLMSLTSPGTRSVLALCAVLLAYSHPVKSQESEEEAIEKLELPDGPIKYEMRIGPIDFYCAGNTTYNDTFDQEPKVLEATATFGATDVLTNDPEKYAVLEIKTGSEWIGLVDLDTGEVNFESQKTVDLTIDSLKNEYGTLSNGLVVDRVYGEYVRGTIHGTIKAYRYIAPLIKEIARCSGESTFLMLPRS